MSKNVMTLYMGYREQMEQKKDKAPKRIIFYRGALLSLSRRFSGIRIDGVSEGQFKQVLEQGRQTLTMYDSLLIFLFRTPSIEARVHPFSMVISNTPAEACLELDISPKITIIVVGNRHHVWSMRFI